LFQKRAFLNWSRRYRNDQYPFYSQRNVGHVLRLIERIPMKYQSRSDRKKRLYKLIVALKDIVDARHACSLFGKEINSTASDLYYPLLNSIVISYSKPFVENKGLGPLPGGWRKFKDRKLQDTHDRLLKFRHDNIAHNDRSTAQVRIIPPGAKLAGQQTTALGVSWAITRHILDLRTFELIWNTIEDLRVRLMQAIDEEMLILYGLSQLPSEPFELTFDDGL